MEKTVIASCPIHSKPLIPSLDLPGFLLCGPDCGIIVSAQEKQQQQQPQETKQLSVKETLQEVISVTPLKKMKFNYAIKHNLILTRLMTLHIYQRLTGCAVSLPQCRYYSKIFSN